MLEHLFGSKTRLRLLRLFFRNPDKAYYVREMSRMVKSQINAVRRELENLVKVGIVDMVDEPADLDPAEASKLARCTWYQLQQGHLFHDELRDLILKTRVLSERALADDIKKITKNLQVLMLTGHFVEYEDAEVDLLIVGVVDAKKLARLIKKYEVEIGKPVRYTVMSPKEYLERQQVVDKFLYSIFQTPHILIVGDRVPLV